MKKRAVLILLILTLFLGAFSLQPTGRNSVRAAEGIDSAEYSAERLSMRQTSTNTTYSELPPVQRPTDFSYSELSHSELLSMRQTTSFSPSELPPVQHSTELPSVKTASQSSMILSEESRPLTAERITGNSTIEFMHITNITAFAASDTVYFSDGAGVFKGASPLYGAGGTENLSSNANGIAFYQGKVLTSRSDEILYKNTPIISLSGGEFGALTVTGDYLLAASGNKVFIYSVSYAPVDDSFALSQVGDPLSFPAAPEQLVTSSKAVYAKVGGRIHKIEGLDSSPISGETSPVSNLRAIAATPSSPLLFCLTGSSVESYSDEGAMLFKGKTSESGGATHLSAGGSKLYLTHFNDGCFSISESAHDFSGKKTIIAGRSDADYFYNAPSGISSRFGEIFVADTGNNRISRLSNAPASHMTGYAENGKETEFDQPVSAALSLEGDLYVAHKNRLTLTTNGKTQTLKDPDGNNLLAQKILLSGSGNVFVLATRLVTRESFVFSADPALSTLSPLGFKNPSAIGYRAGGDVLFFVPNESDGETGAIKNLSGETILECGYLSDFCVDYAGTVFGLNSQGALVSVRGGGAGAGSGVVTTNHGGEYDKIALSSVSNSLCGYGDILLVETATNSLKKISAAAAGVADVSSHFTVPDVENDFTAHEKTTSFVASVRYDAPIFAQPSEAQVAFTAPRGSDVFIRYDVGAPEDMYFVLTEDGDGAALRWGYIYRSALNAPHPYILPPKNNARVIIISGDYGFIYKYPSSFSNKIATVAKGDMIKLISFAANRPEGADKSNGWFADSKGHRWVRVDYGTGEGYILEAGLSWSLFSADNPQPNTNATITNNAPLYVYNNVTQKYELLDGYAYILQKDKRVEVKTPFDSSQKYTQVLFTMEIDGSEEVVDIVVFVETKYVDYDGVDILQIVAICALVVAIILLICLALWLIYKRRRRHLLG